MKSFSKLFSIVFALVFMLNFYIALGQVAIVSNPKRNRKYGGDMILFGNGDGCPPGLIKDGGKKGTSVVSIPNCKPPKKKKEPKVEFVPYPVKEYVPIPMIKEKPIIIEVEKKKEMEMPMMEMDPHMVDMDMGWGMDSKKSVTHVTANKKSDEKQNKKKVVKTSRNENRNREISESRRQQRLQKTSNHQN